MNIAGEILMVSRDAGEMSGNSSKVKLSAEELSMLAKTLQERAEKFTVFEIQ